MSLISLLWMSASCDSTLIKLQNDLITFTALFKTAQYLSVYINSNVSSLCESVWTIRLTRMTYCELISKSFISYAYQRVRLLSHFMRLMMTESIESKRALWSNSEEMSINLLSSLMLRDILQSVYLVLIISLSLSQLNFNSSTLLISFSS